MLRESRDACGQCSWKSFLGEGEQPREVRLATRLAEILLLGATEELEGEELKKREP